MRNESSMMTRLCVTSEFSVEGAWGCVRCVWEVWTYQILWRSQLRELPCERNQAPTWSGDSEYHTWTLHRRASVERVIIRGSWFLWLKHWSTNILPTNEATLPTFTCSATTKIISTNWLVNIAQPRMFDLWKLPAIRYGVHVHSTLKTTITRFSWFMTECWTHRINTGYEERATESTSTTHRSVRHHEGKLCVGVSVTCVGVSVCGVTCVGVLEFVHWADLRWISYFTP